MGIEAKADHLFPGGMVSNLSILFTVVDYEAPMMRAGGGVADNPWVLL